MHKCDRCRNRTWRFKPEDNVCQKNLPQFLSEEEFDCEYFESRYIEYPLTIVGIEDNFNRENFKGLYNCGDLVRISPCGKEYRGETFLGILLGELPIEANISFLKTTKTLKISPRTNPAIFIPELKKIVYGCESWWGTIDKPEDIKDITNEEIENVWYMQLLKSMKRDDLHGKE